VDALATSRVLFFIFFPRKNVQVFHTLFVRASLEFGRTDLTERRVSATLVIEHLDVVMEAFFSSVKSETADCFASCGAAKMELFDYCLSVLVPRHP
jgi:hypothetical protein